jgi:hypothetical protein
MYVCRHDCAALLADSESSIRQSGHLLNVTVEQLRGTLCLDGKDPASFSEAVHMMHVCPDVLRVYSTRVNQAHSAVQQCGLQLSDCSASVFACGTQCWFHAL